MTNPGQVLIYGPDGAPLPPSRPRGVPGYKRGPSALNGGYSGAAFDAADIRSPHMENWRPFLWSADEELNPYRDRIAARARDLERNDGWAKSGIVRTVDNVVGASLRPISKPDYRALAYYTGNKAFDPVWAREYGAAVDACWRTWADDIGHQAHSARKLSVSQMLWVLFRHKILDGDSLAIMRYDARRIKPGGPRYATSVQMIDPDRLCNPQNNFDTMDTRGGVRINPETGEPIGYYIRRAHVGDWFAAAKSQAWDYVERETAWGRPIVLHDFDAERGEQHRGGAGILSAVMMRLKMLIRYDGVELDAAILNAIFAAYVKSPYDPQLVEAAMTGPDGSDEGFGAYQDFRNDFWAGRRGLMGEPKMSMLAPGEEIGTVTAARPNSNFEPFEAAILRHVAAGMGCTYEQLTGDYSRTNYSSFRGAANEAEKTFDRRAKGFEKGTANPMFGCFVEELHDMEDLPLPAGADADFAEFRSAFARCRWIGPAKGYVDEVQEKQGALLGLEGALSTLEIEAAKQGLDWQEIAHQRAIEIAELEKHGIGGIPSWALPPAPGKDAGDKPKVPGGTAAGPRFDAMGRGGAGGVS